MSKEGDGPARGRPRSEAPRKAVFEALAKLVRASTPYELLTIEGIANASGVAKTTIYRRWESKSDIVLDALLLGELDLDTPEVGDSGDLRADLMEWVLAMRERVSRPGHANMARVLLMAGLETPGRGAALSRAVADTGHIVARLETAAQQGEIASGRDLTVAAAALSHPFGMGLVSGEQPSQDWCEELVDLVLGGLRK